MERIQKELKEKIMKLWNVNKPKLLNVVKQTLFVGIVLFNSCIETYDINKRTDNSPSIVFEGTIMSNTEPQTILLSEAVNT